MKSRPILFSGAMIRALLAGTKTQTRRAVKPAGGKQREWLTVKGITASPKLEIAPLTAERNGVDAYGAQIEHPKGGPLGWVRCPYGKPGDLLWVRETFADLLAVSPATDEPMKIGPGEQLIREPTFWLDDAGDKRWNYDGQVIAYAANSDVEFCDGDGFMGDMADRSDMPRWKPSIHMPRWASRLTLRITDVRVQRLQEISEADAIAEGAPDYEEGVDAPPPDEGMAWSYKASFMRLWESINGLDSWAENSWVWCVSFEVIKANVDEVLKPCD